MRTVINELGNTYGRLKVVEAYDWRKHGDYCNVANAALWVCKCECGETTIVAGTSLRSGATKSCGCWRRERTRMQGVNQRGTKKPRNGRVNDGT